MTETTGTKFAFRNGAHTIRPIKQVRFIPTDATLGLCKAKTREE